ncbi:MAG: multidrug efflux SMR transporter [Deltaproteobacteria bacterium]|nr:multidrug efflux SMR transporter [Deltaproteobacteria bacterium]MBW2628668.1 multidrug efflux SMR transporter [Deltaproteobacteria bacterium]
MKVAYVHLGIAIVAEVVATSALKASAGFSQLIPSILVIGGYALAFYMLSIVVESIPVGIAYAVWAGVGVVLVAIAGAIVYRQIPDLAAIIGMALIVAGVVVMHLYSNSIGH